MERLRAPSERGAIRKEPGGKLGVALVYPNAYRLGMANLGLHAVYRLLNDDPRTLCERAFLPETPAEEPRTVESGRALRELDVIAFSLSFEEDYLHVLDFGNHLFEGDPAAVRASAEVRAAYLGEEAAV